MEPYSSTLAWKIPWMQEPGRRQSMGSLRVGHDLSDFTFNFHFHALEKEMATHSSVLAWRIPGTGEPVGSHRVGQDWSELAAAASVYSYHFLISSASVRSIPFVLYCVHFAWNIPLASLIFLKRSLVFPTLLFSSISLHWLLRKIFLSLLAILWNSAFKWVYLSFSHLLFTFFFSQLFVRPPQTAILLFCISFSWGWSCSLSPVQCHEPLSIVHQALCLSDLVP